MTTRELRTARERERVRRRREQDPEWWGQYLRRNAEYRRNQRRTMMGNIRVPLIEEIRAKCDDEISMVTAKRAAFMMDLAARGKTEEDAMRLTNLSRKTVRKYKRRFNIAL